MTSDVPEWLEDIFEDPHDGHARLAVARLAREGLIGKGGFSLKSPAFKNGEELDPCFTADEEDAVAPPLEWTAPPAGAQELVLIVEDPDAPGAETACHWLVWGLRAQQGKLLEGETPPRVGKNSHQNSEWLLPNVPEGDTEHEYVFQLFALDTGVPLMPGASRVDLMIEMKDHVVAAAVLTAKYQAQENGEEWGSQWDDTDEMD
ncbi:YbhB/YbcL family Raf kinase inhibitor-like protein [Altererythrobacter salegens]|uniref:YbhB/YbcL family Raf kinase inhibitor-like protein n=1 Tax=Croceibacterium salegens TaxID=1737568 RepID=A0A6I4SSA0_9SPHN|nr:YbhB/YbcL family Raf kinase inhibitor-like protein [Croceibacterium salegens]MXO58218.1 YbhB/YbcL family Raf kinase inhibitor-like protein [Croceibacterium salegens]